jgi:hypothetical protein
VPQRIVVQKAQQKTQEYLRRYWPNLQVALLGVVTGVALVAGVRAISPHPGQTCAELGQIREEWELGASPRPLICLATLDGELRYGRAIMPEKRGRKHQELP